MSSTSLSTNGESPEKELPRKNDQFPLNTKPVTCKLNDLMRED